MGLGVSIIGSTLPGGNSSSSSVIMAYWAGSGSNVLANNHERMRVSVVQHYIEVHFQTEPGTERVEHVFAYILKCIQTQESLNNKE